MQTSIVRAGTPILRRTTTPVTNIDKSIVKLTEKMLKIMKQAKGLGLAANQIGYSKRLFVFGDNNVVINPMIVSGDTPVMGNEGCLSIPGKNFQVCRFKNVVMTGLDLDGNGKEWTTSDLLARLFQHEIDHLNGKLIVDHPLADDGYDATTL